MKAVLASFAAFTFMSVSALATQINNLPGPLVGSVSFHKSQSEVSSPIMADLYQGKVYVSFQNDVGNAIGGLTCAGEPGLYYLTARAKFGNSVQSGNFQFDTMENCVAVGQAILENPGRKVTFKLNLRAQGGSYIGQVVQVIF